MSLFACETKKEESKPSSKEESVKQEAVEEVVETQTILFFGNSITAGYQLDMEDAFPALLLPIFA